MTQLKKILVPTDFSPHASVALRFAEDLAKRSGASLCLLHAYEVTPYVLPEGVPMYDAALIARLREELGKHLELLKEETLKAGVAHVETKLVEGNPARQIALTAEQWGASLIVMGTHGRTGFAHLLLGSVAEKVVRKSPCAVIAVPTKEEPKAA
jgi:nucleotide-binding universal stress UspA family protein